MKDRRQSEVLHHLYPWLACALIVLMSTRIASCQQDEDGRCQQPGGASSVLAITSDDTALVAAAWGPLLASFNNDCTSPNSPQGVISATISGAFVDTNGGQGILTLCLPRPDLLGGGKAQTHPLVKGLPLCSDCDDTAIGLLDLTLSQGNCNIAAAQITGGTVQSVGYCVEGGDFALTFDASIIFTIECADAETRQASAQLASTVLVTF